jgi:hypothetical protein
VTALVIADGPRRGEHLEAVVEQGYEYDPPWSGLEAWLEGVQGAIPRQ